MVPLTGSTLLAIRVIMGVTHPTCRVASGFQVECRYIAMYEPKLTRWFTKKALSSCRIGVIGRRTHRSRHLQLTHATLKMTDAGALSSEVSLTDVNSFIDFLYPPTVLPHIDLRRKIVPSRPVDSTIEFGCISYRDLSPDEERYMEFIRDAIDRCDTDVLSKLTNLPTLAWNEVFSLNNPLVINIALSAADEGRYSSIEFFCRHLSHRPPGWLSRLIAGLCTTHTLETTVYVLDTVSGPGETMPVPAPSAYGWFRPIYCGIPTDHRAVCNLIDRGYPTEIMNSCLIITTGESAGRTCVGWPVTPDLFTGYARHSNTASLELAESIAARGEDVAQLTDIIDKCDAFDVDTCGQFGTPILRTAMVNGLVSTVRALLRRGANTFHTGKYIADSLLLVGTARYTIEIVDAHQRSLEKCRLIESTIGLAALDLPVLVALTICEQLVQVLRLAVTETVAWEIAKTVKHFNQQ